MMLSKLEILDAIVSEHFIKYPDVELLVAAEVPYRLTNSGHWLAMDEKDFSRWYMFDQIPVEELLGHCFDIYGRLTRDDI
jgi:hypothetical protein